MKMSELRVIAHRRRVTPRQPSPHPSIHPSIHVCSGVTEGARAFAHAHFKYETTCKMKSAVHADSFEFSSELLHVSILVLTVDVKCALEFLMERRRRSGTGQGLAVQVQHRALPGL